MLWNSACTLDGRPSSEDMGWPDAPHDLLANSNFKTSSQSRLRADGEMHCLTGNLEAPKHR